MVWKKKEKTKTLQGKILGLENEKPPNHTTHKI